MLSYHQCIFFWILSFLLINILLIMGLCKCDVINYWYLLIPSKMSKPHFKYIMSSQNYKRRKWRRQIKPSPEEVQLFAMKHLGCELLMYIRFTTHFNNHKHGYQSTWRIQLMSATLEPIDEAMKADIRHPH